jgi:predicted RNase H-like nuclease
MTRTRRALGPGPQSEQSLPEERQEERLLPAERVARERAVAEEPAVRSARSGRRPLGPRGG